MEYEKKDRLEIVLEALNDLYLSDNYTDEEAITNFNVIIQTAEFFRNFYARYGLDEKEDSK